jgi:hypothetical protein
MHNLPVAPAERLARLVAAFRGPIARPRVSVLYVAGLALVMLAMLVLPVLYVATAIAAGWAVLALDAALLTSNVRGSGVIWGLLALNGAGGAAVFFMFKPLFAPRPPRPEPHVIDHLCGVVGAPAPAAINLDCQVNAAAGFRSRILAIHRRDLQLTIGMPLVAGLNLRQFTGVLAHEFGHFSQDAGMRLTAVIRSVNFWFARVVYERDSWDDALVRHAADGNNNYVVVAANAARGAVWVVRRILWVLMTTGHAISCFALRQMEYDADACETQIAGSAAFERTAMELALLNAATQGAYQELSNAWQERRLAADLPALILSCRTSLPADAVTTIRDYARAQKTGTLDTHPSNADRIAASWRLDAAGIFDLDAPASVLFSDFEASSRDVTRWHYQHMMGSALEQAQLLSMSEMATSSSVEREAEEALGAMLGDCVMSIRSAPLGPLEIAASADPRQTLEQLDALVKDMTDVRSDAQASRSRFDPLDDQFLELQLRIGLAEAWAHSGQHVPSSVEPLSALQEEARRVNAEAEEAVRGFDRLSELAGRRISLALGLPGAPDVDAVLNALKALQAHEADIRTLRHLHVQIAGAIRAIQRDPQGHQPIVSPIQNATRVLTIRLNRLRDGLVPVYPFDHAERYLPLGRFIVSDALDETDIGQVLSASRAATGRIVNTYRRLVAHACRAALAAEQAARDSPVPSSRI